MPTNLPEQDQETRTLASVPTTPTAQSKVTPARGTVRIILFFSVFVLLMIATHFAVNSGLRRITTSAYGVSNRVMAGSVDARIVISGSSRALTHYDPRVIAEQTGKSTFNIGRNGSQTDMQVAYLKAYLRNNKKPELVIHNLDLFSFVTTREIYDPAQYLPYLDQPPIYAAIRQIDPDAWKWKYLPLYGYVVEDMRFGWLLGLRSWLGFQPADDQFNGFEPRDLPWTGDFERFRASNQDGVTFDIEPAGVADLIDLIETCQSQSIPLLFVYSPEYREMQALERNRDAIFEKFRELCVRYGIELWDFSSSPISRNRENFYNSQHLNYRGAALFSRELAGKLVETRNNHHRSGGQ